MSLQQAVDFAERFVNDDAMQQEVDPKTGLSLEEMEEIARRHGFDATGDEIQQAFANNELARNTLFTLVGPDQSSFREFQDQALSNQKFQGKPSYPANTQDKMFDPNEGARDNKIHPDREEKE